MYRLDHINHTFADVHAIKVINDKMHGRIDADAIVKARVNLMRPMYTRTGDLDTIIEQAWNR